MKHTMRYTIGLDYGTDSCRALIVDTADGRQIASSEQYYPRWAAGLYCNPQTNQYRQHPLDYIETLEAVVRDALSKAPSGTAEQVVGIAFDTTGSTPALTDREGAPLALLPAFADNPNAMFILWKDHTALPEAEEINQLSRRWPVDYTAYEGGIYSSEWVWAKMLHQLRTDPSLRPAAHSWVEHCDWMPALITGNTHPETISRSRCAAGHKAMWHPAWKGLPSEAFLTQLDPLLSGFRAHLFDDTQTADLPTGHLSEAWARRLGLSTDVVVAGSALDCHFGAVGAQIRPGAFVRVIGTSTCDIMVAPTEALADKRIPGICGQVEGSVLPGLCGLEAGQSAFGDVYAWFRRLLEWPLTQLLAPTTIIDAPTKARLIQELSEGILPELSRQAAAIPLSENTVIATDWMNGRRTPDANQRLAGAMTGLTLGSSAPMLFKALVEATAFGSKAIVDRFLENGIQIKEVIGIGGISQKSPFVMQTLADVLGMPIQVARSEQACALGAAMFAAVAAGAHPTVEEAQAAMGQGFSSEYIPDPARHSAYLNSYEAYRALGRFTEGMP